MRNAVGIFTTRAQAVKAIERLKSLGIPDDRINLLTPEAPEAAIESVPTTEGEQPGLGKAFGAVVGGALGAATGMGLGAVVATMLVPGVGPVIATGVLGAALLGAGGAVVGGAVMGKALDEAMAEGLPKDELFVYEDALRKGRSVVLVLSDEDEHVDAARRVFEQAGAEGIDSARDMWWIGLRDAEKEHYEAQARDFDVEEPNYRRGFEAALHPDVRGKSYDEISGQLTSRYPDVYGKTSFRRGYERGRAHYRGLVEKHKKRS